MKLIIEAPFWITGVLFDIETYFRSKNIIATIERDSLAAAVKVVRGTYRVHLETSTSEPFDNAAYFRKEGAKYYLLGKSLAERTIGMWFSNYTIEE